MSGPSWPPAGPRPSSQDGSGRALPPPAHRPYVIATPAAQRRLEPVPLGRPVATAHRFDPTRRTSAPMLDRIQRLDDALFGPRAMATPRWILYDCAALPGVITGLGMPASELPAPARDRLGLPADRDVLAPISLVLATPMLEDGAWLLYGLGWLDGIAPDLGAVTVAATLDLLRARRVTCTLQWDSPELRVLARHAPLEVLAAWLPAHDHPATCVLRFDVGAPEDRAPGAGVSARSVDAASAASLEWLQGDLEAGRRVWIEGAPARSGAGLRVPLLVSSGRAEEAAP
ncbi:MAG: hypothetical protein IT372_28380 [Polyangiaceae bacterium]|nr:hypothetical protein [Polyangiaceae bacterium]